MKIRTQLIVSIISFCVITFAIGFTLLATFQRLAELDARKIITEKLVLESYQLSDLSSDYILFHEKRQKDQWDSKYSSLATLLSQLQVGRLQEHLIQSLAANHKRLKTIFDQIENTLGQGGASAEVGRDIGFLQVSWSRLSVQIQTMIFDASRLARLTEEERGAVQYRAASLIIGMIGVLIVFILVNYIFINRRVLRSITRLQEGTTIIGAGNLDFRIEEATRDEIGSLARAFNQMSVNLKEVMASKDELNREVAEHGRAEQELVTERERLAVTLRSIGDGVISTDSAGTVLSVNQMAETLTGWPEHEAVGRRLEEVFTIINEETRRPCENPVQKVLEHGQIVGLVNHTVLIGRDGTERILADSGAPIRGANGKISGVVLVFRDVTEQARAEQELRASESFLNNVIDQSPTPMFITDSQGTLIKTNKALRDLMHISDEELVGKYNILQDNIVEEQGFLPLVKSVFERGDTVRFEISYDSSELKHLRVRERAFAVLDITVFPIKNSSGKIANAVIQQIDITYRKQAEELLRESEERLRLAWQTIPGALAITRLEDGMYVDVNNGFTVLSGYAREEVIGKSSVDIPIWHDPVSRQQYATWLLTDGEVKNFEAKMRRKDGQLRTVLMSGTQMTLNGQLHILSIGNDVEELYQAADALQASEEKYRNMFDNAVEGIFQSTPDGRLTTVNPALAKMFGYGSPDEMLGEVTDIAHQLYANPKDRETFKRLLDDPGYVEGYEVECHRKDGTPMWISVNARAIRGEGGGILFCEGTSEDVTSRKQAEQALRRNESLLREAQRVARMGHWEIDLPTGTPVWSDEIFHIFGLDSAWGEPSFAALQDLIHANDWDLLRNSVTRGTTQGIPFDIEFRCIRPDKSIRWMNVKGYPTGKRKGEFFGMFGTAQDITEHKAVQESLRESEERYRAVFDNAGIGIELLDQDGMIIKANKAFLNIIGYAEEELRQRTFLDITHPEDKEISKRKLESLLAGDIDSYRLEKRYLRKDGSAVWINLWSSAIRDAKGDHVGTVAVIEDITHRRLTEEALQESEEKYRTLFEDSIDALFMVTGDGRLMAANKAYFDLLGYEKEEMLGQSVLKIYADPADRPRYSAALLAKGFVTDYPLTLVRKGGQQLDCFISSRIERDKDGNVLSSRGFIRDVTEQKNLQRQLLQAQKMEAIGTLAGGIAHDFNNLLTVVHGFSELLLAEKDRKHPEYADLKKILHAAQSGAELVRRLLTFSRKSEPNPVPMNLNKQIIQIEKLLRRAIPRMVDISLDLSPGLPAINADSSQVEQVLMNLAVNARDAMPDVGKLTVRTSLVTLEEEYCRTHVEATPGKYILLEVTDTGHGMDRETIEHIFEPFFTTKEMGRGTGLGLAMVYGIVKQHSGHITVYSEVGKGTSFRVYLPTIPAEGEPEVEDIDIMPAFGTETVLLVDDEEFVRELGARILSKHGYTVLQAVNGREALDLFRRERSQISLVILDLIMPEMGGAECLRELLEIDPRVNVLVASGYSAESSVRQTVQMGAKGFVAKPFRVKELLRDVRRVLDEG